ncbi:DinB family protein [Bacteroidota bacterium]
MQNNFDQFKDYIINISKKLKQIHTDEVSQKVSEEKWSYIEVLGHLIDSASNNHNRFILGQLQDNLVFYGYAQDFWVKSQNYQEADWNQLIDLWKLYNLHLVHVFQNIPETIRNKKYNVHNFNKIAWRPVPITEPVDLNYLIEDYINHLKHHINQIIKE